MKLKMFIQTNAGVSPKPGIAQRNVRLQTVPRAEDGTSPNDSTFAGNGGAAIIDLQNVLPAEAAALPEGATVTVTITVDQASA